MSHVSLLRRSGSDDEFELAGAVSNDVDSGVEHGGLLMRFTDAAVRRLDSLAECRDAVLRELGEAATIDAAATVANFQRMVRIADGCGIPLDHMTKVTSEEWREDLGLHEFASAVNTPIAAG